MWQKCKKVKNQEESKCLLFYTTVYCLCMYASYIQHKLHKHFDNFSPTDTHTHSDIPCWFMVFGIHDTERIHSLDLIHLFAMHDYMTHPLGVPRVSVCWCVCSGCAAACDRQPSIISPAHTTLLLSWPILLPLYTSDTLLLPMASTQLDHVCCRESQSVLRIICMLIRESLRFVCTSTEVCVFE